MKELSLSSIIVVTAIAGYMLIPTSTTRVVEYGCSVATKNSGDQCPGNIIQRSALRFTVNQKTGAVAWTVDRNAGDWAVTGGVYSKCAVVDSDNWQCSTDGMGETIVLHDGVYLRSSPGTGGYEVPGYTGWHYWRERLLMKSAEFGVTRVLRIPSFRRSPWRPE